MRENRIREAILAQHFEDVDQLADKIEKAAIKVERSTAVLNSLSGAQPTTMPKALLAVLGTARGKACVCASVALAGVLLSAGVAALVARGVPMQPQSLQETEVGQGVVQAWIKLDAATQTRLWNALEPQAQEALAYSLRHRK